MREWQDDPSMRHIHWLKDARMRLFSHESRVGFFRWWFYRAQPWRFKLQAKTVLKERRFLYGEEM